MNCNNYIQIYLLGAAKFGRSSQSKYMYIDIEDIKKKYEANVTSRAIGNVI